MAATIVLDSREVDASSISPHIVELIHQGVAFNSSAEKAIHCWAAMDMEKTKKSCAVILRAEPLNSQKNPSGVLIGRTIDDSVHVHWKGAADMTLPMCSTYYDASGAVKDLDHGQRAKLEQMIRDMAATTIVGCISFAHKQVPEEEYDDPDEMKMLNGNSLTLLGLVTV